jgi:hypothetical protein
MNRFSMPVTTEWLETFVVWIAAIIAIVALLLSAYNTYTLHKLRRELETLRETLRSRFPENPGPSSA